MPPACPLVWSAPRDLLERSWAGRHLLKNAGARSRGHGIWDGGSRRCPLISIRNIQKHRFFSLSFQHRSRGNLVRQTLPSRIVDFPRKGYLLRWRRKEWLSGFRSLITGADSSGPECLLAGCKVQACLGENVQVRCNCVDWSLKGRKKERAETKVSFRRALAEAGGGGGGKWDEKERFLCGWRKKKKHQNFRSQKERHS